MRKSNWIYDYFAVAVNLLLGICMRNIISLNVPLIKCLYIYENVSFCYCVSSMLQAPYNCKHDL